MTRTIKCKGKWARTKGHQFERDIANMLKPVFKDARRHLEYQDAEAYGVDLVNTGIYRIQCKRGKKHAPLSAIKEIECEEFLGEVPILITQGDRERVLAVMPIEEFIRLIAIYNK